MKRVALCCDAVPSPPATFDVVSRAATYLDVHWNLPFDINGVLTGYTIYYQTSKLKIVKITQETLIIIITEIENVITIIFIIDMCRFFKIRNKRVTLYFGFFFSVTGLNLGGLQYTNNIANASLQDWRITGLKPNTSYRVYIAASTAAGMGDTNFLDSRTLTADSTLLAPHFIAAVILMSQRVKYRLNGI